MITWSGVELQCARESLGLSRARLAEFLEIDEDGVEALEVGDFGVPESLWFRVKLLEDIRDEVGDRMLIGVETHPEGPMLVHDTDEDFWWAFPEYRDDRVPVEVHRVAAGLAMAEFRRGYPDVEWPGIEVVQRVAIPTHFDD